MPSSSGIDWDSVPDLGISTDVEVAKRVGTSPSAVWRARDARGIPPAPRHKRVDGWVDWDSVTDLGITADTEIARRLGVSAGAVRGARSRRGITRAEKKQGIDWDAVVDLGLTHDAEIAARLGVGQDRVAHARCERGIRAEWYRSHTSADRAQAKRLRQSRSPKWSLREIGELFGVHASTVSRWVRS